MDDKNIYLNTCICGCNFSYFIDIYNKVWRIGCNYNTNNDFMQSPYCLQGLKDIISLSCGDSHLLLCNSNNQIFILAQNPNEYIKIESNNNKNKILIEENELFSIDLPPITQISSGADFCFCLSNNGKLWSFGKSKDGALGFGNNNLEITIPRELPLNNINYIECGSDHVICKDNNNICYSWGDGSSGQLGCGNYKSLKKPTQCKSWPDDILLIKCGTKISYILTNNGKVYSFGDNTFGQLGVDNESLNNSTVPLYISDLPYIKNIECGNSHCICIDTYNNIWLFGFNNFGQLGLSHNKDIFKPIKHPNIHNVINISHGGLHTFVRTTDEIYAFGNNKLSELGIPSTNIIQSKPVQVFENMTNIWKIKNI